jgi:FK506-binding nuclear protein
MPPDFPMMEGEDVDDDEEQDISDEDNLSVSDQSEEEGEEMDEASDEENENPAASVPAKRSAEQVLSSNKEKVNKVAKVEKALEQTQKSVEKPVEQKKKIKEEPKKEEAAKKPEKKTLPSGLVIEEVKEGQGARAKNGKRVFMRYVGKLTNGKEFDANRNGKPFSFVLGKGEVIKGWDLGIQGMQIGGVRRLTIPAKLAYGPRGAPPDIPSNATLIFDVKLLDVK